MSANPLNPDDPRLTAYALGELEPAERAAVERLLADSPECRAAVDEIRELAGRLTDELRSESAPRLTEDQRATILSACAAVPAPKPAVSIERMPARAPRPVRSSPNWTRRFASLATVAAMVIVVALLVPTGPSTTETASTRDADDAMRLLALRDASVDVDGELALVERLLEREPDLAARLLDRLELHLNYDGIQPEGAWAFKVDKGLDDRTSVFSREGTGDIAEAARQKLETDSFTAERQPGRDYGPVAKESRDRRLGSGDGESRGRNGSGAPAQLDEKLGKKVETYNKLFAEKRYAEAEVLAKQAKQIAPENPAGEVMELKARLAARVDFNEKLRREKNGDKVLQQLDDVELSALGYPNGEIEYPESAPATAPTTASAEDRERWGRFQALRRKAGIAGRRPAAATSGGMGGGGGSGRPSAPMVAGQPRSSSGYIRAEGLQAPGSEDQAARRTLSEPSLTANQPQAVSDLSASGTVESKKDGTPAAGPALSKRLIGSRFESDRKEARPDFDYNGKGSVADKSAKTVSPRGGRGQGQKGDQPVPGDKSGPIDGQSAPNSEGLVVDESRSKLQGQEGAKPLSRFSTSLEYEARLSEAQNARGLNHLSTVADRPDQFAPTVHFVDNPPLAFFDQLGQEIKVRNARVNHLFALRRKAGAESDEGRKLVEEQVRLQNEIESIESYASNYSLGTEAYDPIVENEFVSPYSSPLSTFGVDVDTASYANVRRILTEGKWPPADAVRVEEFLNYFGYDYTPPADDKPFSVNIEIARCPWQADHRLVRVALKGKEIPRDKRPVSNLVFLVDVSGSMSSDNKLPLVKAGLRMLTEQMTESDRVAIVTYSDTATQRLPSTNGTQRDQILGVIDSLHAGGSTNGAAGIQLAYQAAVENYIEGGTNRVILCTDGDFNVGVTGDDQLVQMIQERARTKVFFSVFGYGMGNLKDAKLQSLADKGNGHYGYIDNQREARKVFVEELSSTLVTIAKDVKMQVEFNPHNVGAYRLIGYENRMLAAPDFHDDRKDAGEIGAGHSVTALYEVVPVEKVAKPATETALRYRAFAVPTEGPLASELLTVKLRYKLPESDSSTLVELPAVDNLGRVALREELESLKAEAPAATARASRDFDWASAVAAFAMILRGSEYRGQASFDMVLELAQAAKGEDKSGQRQEFINLVQTARSMVIPATPSIPSAAPGGSEPTTTPAPVRLPADQAQAKATVGGKYKNLLRIIEAERDVQHYGEFRDWGRWDGTTYLGHNELPRGNWVYVYPNWYIWGDVVEGK